LTCTGQLTNHVGAITEKREQGLIGTKRIKGAFRAIGSQYWLSTGELFMMQRINRQRSVLSVIIISILLLILTTLLTSCALNQGGNAEKTPNRISEIAIPSETETQNIKIMNYDMAMAKTKGLVTDHATLSEEYVYLQAVYQACFNRWLDRDGLLANFDASLRADPRDFVPVAASMQEYAQRYGSYGRNYVFVLNSFFIERLSEEDLELLRTASAIDDEALEEMIVRTYKDIIEVREKNGAALLQRHLQYRHFWPMGSSR
jgi:hypothetical protein